MPGQLHTGFDGYQRRDSNGELTPAPDIFGNGYEGLQGNSDVELNSTPAQAGGRAV
jgi:hypothetical protein